MEKKVGVYICKGCEIAKTVDVDKLVEIATGEGKAPICKSYDILCTKEAVDEIKNDIANDGVNRVVVGACSIRVFPGIVRFW